MPRTRNPAAASNAHDNTSTTHATPCPIPGCSFKRELRKHLMQHMRNHHGIPLNGPKGNRKGGDLTAGRKKHAKRFARWLREQGYADEVVEGCVKFFTDIEDKLDGIGGWEVVGLTEDEMGEEEVDEEEDVVRAEMDSGWSEGRDGEHSEDVGDEWADGDAEGARNALTSWRKPPPLTSRRVVSGPRAQYGAAEPSRPTRPVPLGYVQPPYRDSVPGRKAGRRCSSRDEKPARAREVLGQGAQRETRSLASGPERPAAIRTSTQAGAAGYTEDEWEAAHALLVLVESA